MAELFTPQRGAHTIRKGYEFFFPVFNHPYELFALNSVYGWRERCRVAACYLCEAWEGELPVYLLELLRKFDHIFVGVSGSSDRITRITGRPCSYLPMGVDALTFCPYPSSPKRMIEVTGIGRRSPVTHQALLKMSEAKGTFYYYDTVQVASAGNAPRLTTFRVSSPREHRLLYANLLKRSRYFIANRAWADCPAKADAGDGIAARFYEGTAAGAVLLGLPPASAEFREQFGWSGAITSMPFDAPQVAEVIAELERDPDQLEQIRVNNVVNALLHHDWSYRFRTVLEVLRLAPPEGLLERERRLRDLAHDVKQAGAAGLRYLGARAAGTAAPIARGTTG